MSSPLASVSAVLRRLSIDQLVEARAIGLDGAYVRSAIAAGAQPDVESLVELRTLGIRADQIARARSAGARTNDDIVESVMTPRVHVTVPKMKGWPFEGKRAPNTGRPASAPPDWDPPENDPGG